MQFTYFDVAIQNGTILPNSANLLSQDQLRYTQNILKNIKPADLLKVRVVRVTEVEYEAGMPAARSYKLSFTGKF